jgi:hypothetical protein
VNATHVTPGRPRDPEVDRRIAQAALDLFADAGWAGFAMETVARRAGIYAGDTSRVALRLGLEAAAIPGVAEHYAQLRRDQVLAARAIVRRGIDRGEVAPDVSVTLLLDTLIGGAMMHALVIPDDRRADLARNTGPYADQLVSFLLRAVTPP